MLSIATESEAGDSWVNPKLKFTNSNVDYQFKKMLIFAVCYIVDNFSSLKVGKYCMFKKLISRVLNICYRVQGDLFIMGSAFY